MEQNSSGEFRLELSAAEKHYLHALVRRTIEAELADADASDELPPPESDILRRELGAFVTLNKGGRLRGCIGNLVGRGPLYKTVAAMAKAAAFQDPRFPPLESGEFPDVTEEISIMGPITSCPDHGAITVGRHGLIASGHGRQGLLLPQVPVEWGWDRETFLAQTCRKAGLPPDAWKKPGTQILWFEAVVI
ncbi:AmmeMemoRadiSam system protein A [Desulfovibrio sp. OttesenSCG-928-I05]|nr:AmmeMemoRadiSam system protein A [Desulfovibrio sp. OttesenSCG-928-I05]